MDTAAIVAQTATALLVVVADLIDLLHRALGTGGTVEISVITAVSEAALLGSALAFAITESKALTTTTGLARGRTFVFTAVGKAALVATLAGAVAEVEALTTAAGLLWLRGAGLVAVGKAALITTLTVASITEGEAFVALLLAASAGCTLHLFLSAVGEVAFVTTLAFAFVTESKAFAPGLGLTDLVHGAFVLAAALVTEGALTALVVAADLIADVASVAGVVGTMGEAAAVAVGALTSFSPVEAFATFPTLSGRRDRLTFGVLEFAVFAEAAAAVVAEGTADLDFFFKTHLK